MAKQTNEDTGKGALTTALKKLAVVVGILAGIASLISLWWQARQPKPELEAVIVNAEKLPPEYRIPNVKINVLLGDQQVETLWIVRIKIHNSGDVTLVTTGPKQNTIDQVVSLAFSDSFTILDVRPEGKNFPCELVHDDRTFSINFEQWRKFEFLELSAYVATKREILERPGLMARRRYLVDGEIFVRDSSHTGPKVRSTVLDRLPTAVAAVLRWTSASVLSFLVGAIVIWMFSEWKSVVRSLWWRIVHSRGYYAVENSVPAPKKKDDALLEACYQARKAALAASNIPHPPAASRAMGSISDIIVFNCVAVFLVIVLTTAVAGLIML